MTARSRARGPRRARRGQEGIILSALLLLSALVPFCTFQWTRITLQVQGGGRGDARRLNPDGGPLFHTTHGWPPFVGSSLPFWVAAACLVTAVIILWRSPRDDGVHPLDVPLVAYMGFVGGVWSILFALPFQGLDAWPRDSAVAGAIEIVCSMRVVVEMVRGRHRRRKERRMREAAQITDGIIGEGPGCAQSAEAASFRRDES